MIISKKLFSLLIGVSFAFGCDESVGTRASDHSFKEKQSDNTFLWKIDGNGLEKPSFLFGTIHMIPEEYYKMGKSVESALRSSDLLLTEVKMSDLSALAFSDKLEFDGNWIDSLNQEDQDEIVGAIDEALGIGREMSKKMFGSKKPFLAFSSLMLKELGGSQMSFEYEITSIADDEDIENEGLETAVFQLELFDQIPRDSVIGWMLKSIRSGDNDMEDMEEIFIAYRDEELTRMVELMQTSSPELMAYEDLFLNDRNASWIPKIEEQIKTKSCFIAVGAGHLPGKKGIIELLRAQGYTVTPLESD